MPITFRQLAGVVGSVGLVALVNQAVHPGGLPILVSPLGAASAGLFCREDHSPDAWVILGGVVVSAVAGLGAADLLGLTPLGCCTAAGGALLAMGLMRCFYAPGVAVSLATVLGGEAVRGLGLTYSVFPIAADWLILLLFYRTFVFLWPDNRGRSDAPAPASRGSEP